MIKTVDEMIAERLTIQEGPLKGARVTITVDMVRDLMVDYHTQFDEPDENSELEKKGYSFETGV
jgi:hypothetical protein